MINMNKKIKILVVGATHGHEFLGVDIIKKINQNNIGVDVIVGNPKAFKSKKAFLESDLNRVFPGNNNGNYEERRAFELNGIIRNYDMVFDIHSTNTVKNEKERMLIITKINNKINKIINLISPPRVLFMDFNQKGSLIYQVDNGIAFEYGDSRDRRVEEMVLNDLGEVFVESCILKENIFKLKNFKKEKTIFYQVYDSFKKPKDEIWALNPNLENFKIFSKKNWVAENQKGKKIYSNDDFIPILFGKNRYENIFGFKAKIIKNLNE